MTLAEYRQQFPSAQTYDSELREKFRTLAIDRGAIPPNLSFEERSASRKGRKTNCNWKDPIARGRAISASLAVSPKRKAFNGRMKLERLGKNNPAYKGGCKYLYISAPEQTELRKKIRIRDNHKCVVCGSKGWCVHHIDHNEDNWDNENLITMCNIHHSATNHGKTVEQVKEEYHTKSGGFNSKEVVVCFKFP